MRDEETMRDTNSTDQFSRSSGKERTSSSSFYDELDSLPASPTVFGVRLKSTRHSRKSGDSHTERPASPSSPLSPISPGADVEKTKSPSSPLRTASPGAQAGKTKSKFPFNVGFKRTKSESETKKEDKKTMKRANQNQNQLTTETTWYTEREVNDRQSTKDEKSSGKKDTFEDPSRTFNKKSDKNDIHEDATKTDSETLTKDTKIENLSEKAMMTAFEDPSRTDSETLTNNTEIETLNEKTLMVDTIIHPKTSNGEKATSNSINNENEVITTAADIVSVAKPLNSNNTNNNIETLNNNKRMNCILPHKNTEPDNINSDQKDEDTNTPEVMLRRPSKEGGLTNTESQSYNDQDVFQVQMRKSGRTVSIRQDEIISENFDDFDVSQLEISEPHNHSDRSYNSDTDPIKSSVINTETRSADSEKVEKSETKQNLKSKVVDDTEAESIKQQSSEHIINPLGKNGDVYDAVFIDEGSSRKTEVDELNLVAYHKLISFLQQLDKNYDIEYYRLSTEYPVASLEEVLSNNC